MTLKNVTTSNIKRYINNSCMGMMKTYVVDPDNLHVRINWYLMSGLNPIQHARHGLNVIGPMLPLSINEQNKSPC